MKEAYALARGKAESAQLLETRLLDEQTKREEAEIEMAVLRTRLTERERALDDWRERLEAEFKGMNETLLKQASEGLLTEAKHAFEKQQAAARADAGQYKDDVQKLLAPMAETLTRYEAGLREMRDHQKAAQGALAEQITALGASAGAVAQEARGLAGALKAGPGVRGRWGEVTLRNTVERAGLSAYCDFEEQAHARGETGALRPDMVVRLPGERVLAVDSKVPLADWLAAQDAADEAGRTAAGEAHTRAVWSHVQSLAGKGYAEALRRDGSLDFVVLFLPGDAFLAAAMARRPALFDEALAKGVLLATPSTLLAMLKSVAFAWRQERATGNAKAVAGLAADLYQSLERTGIHLSELGRALDRTVKGYNELVGNMEGRVFPRARRFADFEMPGTEKPLPEPPRAERAVRQVSLALPERTRADGRPSGGPHPDRMST